MRYQKIEVRIWHDEKFARLTPSQQRLFLYLLLCPHGNLTGCFVLKEGYVTADLKCLTKDFRKDFSKLCESGLIRYDFEAEVLLIPNLLKHNPLTNPNQRKAAIKILTKLPKTPLLKHFLGLIEGLPEGLGEVLLKPEDRRQKTETETEERLGSRRPPSTLPLLSPESLGKLWNEKADSTFPRVLLPFNNGRKTKFLSALKEHPDLSWWDSLIEKTNNLEFLKGENDRGWRADLEFVVRKRVEILEGKYDRAAKISQEDLPEWRKRLSSTGSTKL